VSLLHTKLVVKRRRKFTFRINPRLKFRLSDISMWPTEATTLALFHAIKREIQIKKLR